MITSSYFTVAIVLMACITFTVRYLFFTQSFQIRLHPRIERLLVFTAPCILTAMAVPIVFQDGLSKSGEMALLSSSYFWAGLLAIGLSLLIRQTLLVILLSMLGFYAMRYFGLR